VDGLYGSIYDLRPAYPSGAVVKPCCVAGSEDGKWDGGKEVAFGARVGGK